MAFVIILGTMLIFTSPTYQKFYTEKILKKEYKPAQKPVKEEQVVVKDNQNEFKEKETEKGIQEDSGKIEVQQPNEVFDTIWIENKKIRVGVKEEGAIITNIIMKKYHETGKDTSAKIELIEEKSEGGSQLVIGNKNYDKKIFRYTGSEKNVWAKKEKKRITFTYENENGEKLSKIYELDPDGYKIEVKIEKNQLSGQRIDFGWFCGIKESEKQQQRNMYNKRTVHYYNDETVEHIALKKEMTEEPSGRYKWLGITSKYFFISINQEKNEDTDLKITSFEACCSAQEAR